MENIIITVLITISYVILFYIGMICYFNIKMWLFKNKLRKLYPVSNYLNKFPCVLSGKISPVKPMKEKL